MCIQGFAFRMTATLAMQPHTVEGWKTRGKIATLGRHANICAILKSMRILDDAMLCCGTHDGFCSLALAYRFLIINTVNAFTSLIFLFRFDAAFQ